MRLLRTEVWGAKEEDAHGHSRPGAVTGRGLPPNVSYERWPSASNPQSTSAPVADGGVWAATSPFTGCAACRTPASPALKAGLSEGHCCWDLFLAGAMRRPAGCGTGTGVPPFGSEPTRLTRAILNTGRWANQRPHRSTAAAYPRPASPSPAPWVPPSGAQLRVRCEGSKVGRAGAPRRATLNCQPLWRLRPSDATWKQRLGLITLFRGGVLIGVPIEGGWALFTSGHPAATPYTFEIFADLTRSFSDLSFPLPLIYLAR